MASPAHHGEPGKDSRRSEGTVALSHLVTRFARGVNPSRILATSCGEGGPSSDQATTTPPT